MLFKESLLFMFDNFYTLLNKEKDFFEVKLACDNHEIFKAHFPGNPIVPGFVLFEICSCVRKDEIKKITKAKFFEVISPESILYFYFEEEGKKVNIKVQKDHLKVAELVYEKI